MKYRNINNCTVQRITMFVQFLIPATDDLPYIDPRLKKNVPIGRQNKSAGKIRIKKQHRFRYMNIQISWVEFITGSCLLLNLFRHIELLVGKSIPLI